MNLGVLLGSIFAVLGASATVALKSYKSAPEPIESSHNLDASSSGSSSAITPIKPELIVPNPTFEEVNS